MSDDWRNAGEELEEARRYLERIEGTLINHSREELFEICSQHLSPTEMIPIGDFCDEDLRSFTAEIIFCYGEHKDDNL